MAIVAPLQSSFSGGEISPLVKGRVDSERYKTCLDLCRNWIATLQGGLMRRPGTYFLGMAGENSTASRLIPFKYSTEQANIIEFFCKDTDGLVYIRIWTNYGVILTGDSPMEILTPYLQTEIDEIKHTQSADVLYLVHPKHHPAKLVRYSGDDWSLIIGDPDGTGTANLPKWFFTDGPYQPINTEQTTLDPGSLTGEIHFELGPTKSVGGCAAAISGEIRVTCTGHGWKSGMPVLISSVSGTVEANGYWWIDRIDDDTFDLRGSTFVNAYVSGGSICAAGYLNGPVLFAGDFLVGSSIRVENAGAWYWGRITANGEGFIDAFFTGTLPNTNTITSWQIGLWYMGGTSGEMVTAPNYPSCAGFHEDRLFFGGTPSNPQQFDASVSADYENFAPTERDDETGSPTIGLDIVTDRCALSFSLNSNDVNKLEWFSSEEKGLIGGSVSAEWVIRPSSASEAMTPTNISAKKSTAWGSADIQDVQIGKATIHVQRGGKKVRELSYSWDIDGYRSTDLTELAMHITGTGIVDIAAQLLPHPVIWMVRADGALIGLTYDRDMTQLRVGWHQHIIGGSSDSGGSPAKVESIAVIPSPDGTCDDLWMCVRRYVNGKTVRHIEYLDKPFDNLDDDSDAFFVDSGLTLDNPITIKDISNENPAVVSYSGRRPAVGSRVRIDDVVGLIENEVSLVNGKLFTVAATSGGGKFALAGLDASGATAYSSGGEARKLVTDISGLSHLKGETVSILADGVVYPAQVVTDRGHITLPVASAIVTVGYKYNSDARLLRLEAGSRNGTSLGKTRRTHRVGVMVDRTQSLLIGPDFDNLDLVEDTAELFSGIASQTVGFDYDFNNQICFRADQPLPATVLAVMPMLETQDRT